MKKSEKIEYLKKAPAAVYCFSNCISIAIKEVNYGIDDYIVYQWMLSDHTPEPADVHISKINYGVNKTTFRAGRYTIDLAECMRV